MTLTTETWYHLDIVNFQNNNLTRLKIVTQCCCPKINIKIKVKSPNNGVVAGCTIRQPGCVLCRLMPHEELSLWLQIIFINVVNYFEELSSQGSCGLHNEQYVSTRHVKSPGLMIQQNVIILQQARVPTPSTNSNDLDLIFKLGILPTKHPPS